MKRMKTILHPTDFSEHSQYAFEVACALARDQKARLLVLHAVPVVAAITGGEDVQPYDRTEHYQQDMKNYQEQMKKRLQELEPAVPHIEMERFFREGEPGKVILEAADNAGCDLIIMGTHGVKPMVAKILGSVAHEVVKKATCPVLTVKMPQKEKAKTEKPETAGAHAR